MTDEKKQPEMKEVRATEMGFYGGVMIPAGKTFSVPVTFKAKWVVDASVEEKPKRQRKEPETLKELGSQKLDTNAERMQQPKQ